MLPTSFTEKHDRKTDVNETSESILEMDKMLSMSDEEVASINCCTTVRCFAHINKTDLKKQIKRMITGYIKTRRL